MAQQVSTDRLPVMEAFYTIQGEGFHSGKAAYFVRLGGCDVGCVWCDVKESWDASMHEEVKVNDIAKLAHDFPCEIVVVTGGEPLMYDLAELCSSLHNNKKNTHLETSGAYPLTGDWDWICLSPKKFKAPLSEIVPLAHELKVIVCNKSDFEWGEEYASLVNPGCKLYLQPEWDKRAEMMPLIADYVKSHPRWEISLQTHKILNVP